MSAIEQAQQAGFDLSLIDESLRCSHEERARRHQAALDLALELVKIGKQLRDRAQSSAAETLRR